MPTNTYWLPYPALLKRLGFTLDRKNSWAMKTEGNTRRISWFTRQGDSTASLLLADGPCPVFLGELQSEAEFITLLRQVRWAE